jgi:hypothetical protein
VGDQLTINGNLSVAADEADLTLTRDGHELQNDQAMAPR